MRRKGREYSPWSSWLTRSVVHHVTQCKSQSTLFTKQCLYPSILVAIIGGLFIYRQRKYVHVETSVYLLFVHVYICRSAQDIGHSTQTRSWSHLTYTGQSYVLITNYRNSIDCQLFSHHACKLISVCTYSFKLKN